MPTYVYRCKRCAQVREVNQRIRDLDPKYCAATPDCDGEIYRAIQPVGIAFRGSGFHVNDYPRR